MAQRINRGAHKVAKQREQEDAQEFLTFLLDSIHQEQLKLRAMYGTEGESAAAPKKRKGKKRKGKKRKEKKRKEKKRKGKERKGKDRKGKERKEKKRKDKTRQDKTRQDKTRQDKTRKEKNCHHMYLGSALPSYVLRFCSAIICMEAEAAIQIMMCFVWQLDPLCVWQCMTTMDSHHMHDKG